MDEILIVVVEFVRGFPLDRSPRRTRTFWQGVLDRRLDVVFFHWRRRDGREVIAFIGNGGVIYWLPGFVCCSPCDTRGSCGRRVIRHIAISAAMIVNDWVVLGASHRCPNVADGPEIPKVLRIAAVLVVVIASLFAVVGFFLHPRLSTFRVVQ